ncbi:hypothetical protein GCM10018787_06760 [Streptomyces thermodiastaticus]|nr:hypothetical protein GCM10018787_06760 [Streptomyces thermodiastaticus]
MADGPPAGAAGESPGSTARVTAPSGRGQAGRAADQQDTSGPIGTAVDGEPGPGPGRRVRGRQDRRARGRREDGGER